MSTKPRILVTSAAGKTGLPTAMQLLEKGHPVRAFVHRDDHRAERLKSAGAEVFVGDQYALADMRQAMQGVRRAYHCAPTAPNGLHFGAVFAIAAQEQRLEHVVILSQWLAHSDHPSLFTRETWLSGEVMDLLPDTSVTVNNVGWFADNYFMVLESMAQLGMFPMPLGDGDAKTDAPPSSEDIASVSVAALIDPASHAGKTYRPTGPELLSPNEIADTMGRVLGREVVYRDISEKLLLKAFTAQGFARALQTQFVLYAEEYRRGAFAVNAPTDVVRDVGGRKPEDFERIARRMVATRPEGRQTFANKLRALRNFARVLVTPAFDPDRVERERDHVLLRSPDFAWDSAGWRNTHDPDAGFVPDSQYGRGDAAILDLAGQQATG